MIGGVMFCQHKIPSNLFLARKEETTGRPEEGEMEYMCQQREKKLEKKEVKNADQQTVPHHPKDTKKTHKI